MLDCFKTFKNLVESQKSKKIKILRSDNGGEFCRNEIEKFLARNGIIHQKTNPYTPEQNGMSERLNRTVVEKAKCLLFDANLEKRFWAEAVNTSVYLKNRSAASGLQKTPYEIWTGEKPDVSSLRIFGSTVMVHIPKEKRRKWDKKSAKQILIGYSENVKGYRVHNPSNNTVTTSRDVPIVEKISDDVSIMVNQEEKTCIGGSNDKSSDSVGDSDAQDSLEEDTLASTSTEENCLAERKSPKTTSKM